MLGQSWVLRGAPSVPDSIKSAFQTVPLETISSAPSQPPPHPGDSDGHRQGPGSRKSCSRHLSFSISSQTLLLRNPLQSTPAHLGTGWTHSCTLSECGSWPPCFLLIHIPGTDSKILLTLVYTSSQSLVVFSQVKCIIMQQEPRWTKQAP